MDDVVQRFPTFFRSVPPSEKRKLAYPLVSCEKAFYDIFINLKSMKIWRIPLKIFHLPLGVRVPQVGA